jgi:hypothetical protein
MPVKINSSGGGSVTLSSGSIATDVTATFPATTGNAVVDTAVQTLTNKTLTSPTITGAVVSSMASSVLTLGTAQASTSGTSIDFTGIPSWVRRVTVMFNGVSTNGSSNIIVQLGSGSFATTGYSSQASNGTTGYGVVTTGIAAIFGISAASVAAGQCVLTQISTNLWAASCTIAFLNGTGACTVAAGVSPTLAGALDRVRITTVGGTDTFDAGSINIVWE